MVTINEAFFEAELPIIAKVVPVINTSHGFTSSGTFFKYAGAVSDPSGIVVPNNPKKLSVKMPKLATAVSHEEESAGAEPVFSTVSVDLIKLPSGNTLSSSTRVTSNKGELFNEE